MNRTEMIDELLERLETELDELNNGQLANLLSEYEHSSILSSVIENLADEDEENDEEDEEDEDVEELPLIDDEWSDEEADDE